MNQASAQTDFTGETSRSRVGRSRSRGPRALIIDKRAVMATEMCRQLARKGFSVAVFGERDSPVFSSRYCDLAVVSPPFTNREQFMLALRRTIRSSAFEAVFVCNEEVLEQMLDFAGIDQCAGLVLPARRSLRTALSKSAMQQIAHEAGVRAPRTIRVASEADLAAAARELGFPMIVKGDRGEAGQHVRLVTGRADLDQAYREIVALELHSLVPPMLQEFIRGTAYSIGGLYDCGRAVRVCAHRKLVAVPPLGGLTVRGITESCPGLTAQTFRIVEALNYSGLAHIEFIRDSRGALFFLEINPRAWGTIGVAHHAGVDFYAPYRALAAGYSVPSRLEFSEGVRFHRLLREARMVQRRPSRVFGLIRDCVDPSTRSDFEWLDPMPHFTSFVSRGLDELRGALTGTPPQDSGRISAQVN